MASRNKTSYLPRTIEPVINEVSKRFKVVFLTGLRQAGKSTCLLHLATGNHKRDYLNLDDAVLMDEAKNATGQFFLHHPTPLLLDAIQRTPGLFQQIKAVVDDDSTMGQIWATGSQKFSLMKGVHESLAGRLIPLELLPFSIYERAGRGLDQRPYIPSATPPSILDVKTPEETWKTIWQGAWPGVVNLSPRQRKFFFDDLVGTYLERDVHLAAGVEKLQEFRRFLRILASRTGEELRISTLSQEVDVSSQTIKNWLAIAEASGIIYLLRPYYANIKKQLVKSPKVYFTDTGLAAYLCGLDDPESLRNYKDAGAFFETFVVTEILKSWVHNGEHPDFFFFRDSKQGTKIDLLIRHQGKLHPIEIKLSANPDVKAIKNFSVLDDLPEAIGHGAVVCLSPKIVGLNEHTTVHSIWNI